MVEYAIIAACVCVMLVCIIAVGRMLSGVKIAHPARWSMRPIAVRRPNGEIEEVLPKRTCGLHLVAETQVGNRQTAELIGSYNAVDELEFWRAWRHLGGQCRGWVDEDGQEYKVAQ